MNRQKIESNGVAIAIWLADAQLASQALANGAISVEYIKAPEMSL